MTDRRTPLAVLLVAVVAFVAALVLFAALRGSPAEPGGSAVAGGAASAGAPGAAGTDTTGAAADAGAPRAAGTDTTGGAAGAEAPGAAGTDTTGGAAGARGSTAAAVARLQAEARARPRDARVLAALGEAYLQRVRETGDPSFYARADGVLRRARTLAPRSPQALTAAGTLALALHDFRGALAFGRAARRAEPPLVAPLGVVVDAQLELGRYGAAARTLQEMVDRKPGLASYARVSYFRELHGDLAGAEAAMRLAAAAGATGGAAEHVAFVETQVGDLAFARGHLRSARRAYRSALARVPGHLAASVGLARVAAAGGGPTKTIPAPTETAPARGTAAHGTAARGTATRRTTPHGTATLRTTPRGTAARGTAARGMTARGGLDAAIRRLRSVVARLPLPQYAVALGELELAAGRPRAARRDLALVRVQQRLLRAAGVDTDVDLALFEADHGAPRRAVALARAAWAQAPSVRSADALGWALTRAGRPAEGVRWARRALRLGSRDPAFLYHAGVAAAAAGERRAAVRWLRASLAANPHWSPLHAPRARRALEALR